MPDSNSLLKRFAKRISGTSDVSDEPTPLEQPSVLKRVASRLMKAEGEESEEGHSDITPEHPEEMDEHYEQPREEKKEESPENQGVLDAACEAWYNLSFEDEGMFREFLKLVLAHDIAGIKEFEKENGLN